MAGRKDGKTAGQLAWKGEIMDIYEESLELHEKYRGKLEVTPKVPCESPRDLSLAYTPGVAQPCLEIQKNPENAYR